MAKIVNGLISGKVGNQVYFVRDGVQHVKDLPLANRERSPRQKAGSKVFGLAATFLSPYRSLIERTWTCVKGSGTKRFQAAFSFVKINVIKEDGLEPVILYHRLLVSRGGLEPAPTSELILMQDMAKLNWTMKTESSDKSSPDDKLTLLLINEDQDHYMLFEHAAKRADLQAQIALPPAFISDNLHGYMFFTDMQGRTVSDSTYLLPVRSG